MTRYTRVAVIAWHTDPSILAVKEEAVSRCHWQNLNTEKSRFRIGGDRAAIGFWGGDKNTNLLNNHAKSDEGAPTLFFARLGILL